MKGEGERAQKVEALAWLWRTAKTAAHISGGNDAMALAAPRLRDRTGAVARPTSPIGAPGLAGPRARNQTVSKAAAAAASGRLQVERGCLFLTGATLAAALAAALQPGRGARQIESERPVARGMGKCGSRGAGRRRNA